MTSEYECLSVFIFALVFPRSCATGTKKSITRRQALLLHFEYAQQQKTLYTHLRATRRLIAGWG